MTPASMAVHHFFLRLTFKQDALGAPVIGADEFLDAVEGPLFDAFQGDVSPSFRGGQAYLECDVEAETVDAAVRRVAREVLDVDVGSRSLPLRSLVVDDA